MKVDRAISMLDLRQLLPRAVFETCFSGEGVLLENVGKKQLYYFFEHIINEFGFFAVFQSFWMAYTAVCVSWFLLRRKKPARSLCYCGRSRKKML